MNTYLMTKGGQIPTGSAGGHPQDEKKPRTEDKEPEHGEREPLEKGCEAGPSRRRNTPARPRGRSGEHKHRQCLRSDAPEGVVVELKEGVRVQNFSCSGATSGKCTHRKADK